MIYAKYIFLSARTECARADTHPDNNYVLPSDLNETIVPL